MPSTQMPHRFVMLHQEPAWCSVRSEYLLVFYQLTLLSELWIPALRNCVIEASNHAPNNKCLILSIFRVDKRFPICPGYELHMLDFAETYRDLKPRIRACAAHFGFGGIIEATFRFSLHTFEAVARPDPAIYVGRSVMDSILWLSGFIEEKEPQRMLRDSLQVVSMLDHEMGYTSL